MWCHSRRHTNDNVKKFSKNSQIIKEFFYWNFFSVSWLDVFNVKEHLWRHSCSDDVTLCKNILPNINFSSPLKFHARVIYHSKELSPVIVLQHLKVSRKILDFAQNTPPFIFAHTFCCPSGKVWQDALLNSS